MANSGGDGANMKLTEEGKECAFDGTFLRTKIAFISREKAPGADLRMEEFKIMVQIVRPYFSFSWG